MPYRRSHRSRSRVRSLAPALGAGVDGKTTAALPTPVERAWQVPPPPENPAAPTLDTAALLDTECCAAPRTRRTFESGDVYVLTVHRACCPVWSAR